MQIEYSLCSDVGNIRSENQDTVFVSYNNKIYNKQNSDSFCNSVDDSSPIVFAVFDGMGGEQEGAKASYIAAFVTSEVLKKRNDTSLKKICIIANETICRYMDKNEIGSMGTTAAIVKTKNDKIVACNIGDSSIFKVTEGKIKELSVKHVLSVGSTGRGVLTQHLGIPESEMLIEPHSVTTKAKDGDIFVICSDGVTDVLSNEEIRGIVEMYPIKEASQAIVDKAMEKGSKDNVSAIVLKLRKEG